VPRILDYNGNDAERAATVASIRAQKTLSTPLAQVTAGTADEAAAAEAAGIEMVVCLASSVAEVRTGSPSVFLTAAIDFDGAVTEDDLLGHAYRALSAGADAVITARGLRSVARLTHEDLPVMGHLGFIPKKSTLYGGVRTIGKTAVEATTLWHQFQRLEDAGAFAVECELIAADVMAEISSRTEMATISLGSGSDADVLFLFTSDICGEGSRLPRHARAYGDLASLHEQIKDERVRSLRAFRNDVASKGFPEPSEISTAGAHELAAFVAALDG
jgi:3-methyl-2-oxobutanoate hydroxymethyltransferase